MSRVDVDQRACRRHGLCALVAPNVFDLGRDGRVRVTQPKTPEALHGARDAERYCPLQAIRVERHR